MFHRFNKICPPPIYVTWRSPARVSPRSRASLQGSPRFYYGDSPTLPTPSPWPALSGRLSSGRTHSNLKIIVNMRNRSDLGCLDFPKIVLDWEGGRSHSDIEPTETVDAWWSPSNPSGNKSIFVSRIRFSPLDCSSSANPPSNHSYHHHSDEMVPEALVLAISGTSFWGSESYMRLKNPQNADYPLFFSLSLPHRFVHLLWFECLCLLFTFHFSLPLLYLRMCRSGLISIDIDII